MNHLYYGDNLEVLPRHVDSSSVDLIYLDPPFNSKKSYNILFKPDSPTEARAQIEAFDDTWTWSQESEEAYIRMQNGGAPAKVADAIEGLRRLLGTNDVLAYLVMMTERLLEIRRTLKNSGSVFLHCDPTASHYLKIMLDTVFGPSNFVNEIAWCYDTGGRSKTFFPRKHDVIFWYRKSASYFFNYDAVALPRNFSTMHEKVFTDDDGRSYQTNFKNGKEYRYYLDKGVLPNDWWTDIQALNPAAKERLGYPTQKPVALLERIIKAACPEDGVVLDPFCGCGTALDAAQKLRRPWIGIDITYLAVDLIDKRLRSTYRSSIKGTYQIEGIPHDLAGARALFDRSPLDFERWAVSLVQGQPNERQVGDKGVDGVIRFPLDAKGSTGRAIVSVKGGATVGPTAVRDLIGTIKSQGAEMGILITLASHTRGVVEAAKQSGIYAARRHGQSFPVVQIFTIADLLAGKRPQTPPPYMPYIQAERARVDADVLPFG